MALVTLGVCFFAWYYKTKREAQGFDTRIEVNPVGALLAVLPG
jgi:hypothetical protein